MKRNRAVFIFCAAVLLCACASGARKTGVEPAVQKQVASLSAAHALVVARADGQVRAYDGRGLGPLFNALKDGGLKDAYVYDKVTGRASALLLAYGGAKELNTGMLSSEAVPVLEKYRIKYTAAKTVPYILNRAKTGSCPMETLARNLDDAQEAYPRIKAGFEALTAPR